ncbi:jg18207 [Pararge aegeria aegeria]|uniref:Jg18207 protein n=1 Tax=Pararge aegeria aegeria TaxID=348720 RepID=A0A8S4QKN4_9NEOP|nr:jg18207 [Pararge aegeria aegeria]
MLNFFKQTAVTPAGGNQYLLGDLNSGVLIDRYRLKLHQRLDEPEPQAEEEAYSEENGNDNAQSIDNKVKTYVWSIKLLKNRNT